MLGAVVRNAGAAVGGAFLGALLSRGLAYFLPLMGPTNGLLYRSFAGIGDNALLVMLLSAGIALFARATVEGGVGG